MTRCGTIGMLVIVFVNVDVVVVVFVSVVTEVVDQDSASEYDGTGTYTTQPCNDLLATGT